MVTAMNKSSLPHVLRSASTTRLIRGYLLALISLFCLVVAYALVKGDFWSEGAILLSLSWGVVALVDLYIGFLIFALFVFATEPRLLRAGIWVVLLMVFGNVIAALYVYRWVRYRHSGQC